MRGKDQLTFDGFSTSAGLGAWIKRELASATPDLLFIPRVITQELSRWENLPLEDAELNILAADHPETGDPKWDALVEGLVARIFDTRYLTRPEWTERTILAEVFAPYGDLVTNAWYAIDFLNTPTVLLHKHIVFARQNLQRL